MTGGQHPSGGLSRAAVAVALLVAGLACAPPAQAATPLGAFDAEIVRLPAGGLVHGNLVALQSDVGTPDGALPTFYARGNMTLEADELENQFALGGVHYGVTQEYRATREELGQAQAALVDDTAAGRGTFYVFVRALGGTFLSSVRVPDLALSAPDVEAFTHVQLVEGAPARPEMEVPVQGTHDLQVQGDLVVEATGDFLIALYNLDLTIAAAGGVRQVRTGEVPSGSAVQSPVANPAVTYVGPSVQRQAYLHVRDGTLSLRVPASTLDTLYFEADDAATPGQVEVGAPVGTVLPGPAEVDFDAPRDGLLPIRASALDQEELERFLRDAGGPAGQAAPATDAPLPASLRWGWAGLAAAALAVALAAVGLARRRAAARMQLLFGAGRYAEAERAAARLLATGPPGDAALVRAVCLLRLGRPDEADGLLAGRAGRRVDGAARDFLVACVRALQRRPAEAARHLALCLAADPGYRAEALANPWLRGLVPRGHAPDDSRRGRAAA